MKFKELENRSQEELQSQLKDLRMKLGKFKFDVQSNNLKDNSQISKSRKDIARLMTALNK